MNISIFPRSIVLLTASVVLLSVAPVSQAADADAAKATARQNNCFRCHSVDKEKDGPAWSKVSAKYKGVAGAEAKLTQHLTSGEKAKFPDGHEEEHTIVKTSDEAELKNLVEWILSL